MTLSGSGSFRKPLLVSAIVLVVMVGFASIQSFYSLSRYYFVSHDVFAALAILIGWGAVLVVKPRFTLPDNQPSLLKVCIIAGFISALLWAGTYAVMFNYPVSRDEHMAVFDSGIFAKGLLAEPLPEQWAGFADSFAASFLLQTPDQSLMVSSYLPVNAAIRGGVSLIADPALTGPILAAIGCCALYFCARHLLSEMPSAILVVLAAYLLSAQVLVTAMTAYAMTAHLALNLVWLALFLKDRWWSHGLAMLVGVAAMGLHQFVFHPLFAGPFILLLAWRRQWLMFLGYGAVYAAGTLLWISWGAIVMSWAGIDPGAGPAGSGGLADFVSERILPLIVNGHPHGFALMVFNLLRTLTWNAVFVLPLMGCAWVLVRRRDPAETPIVLALFGGIILTILAMAVLLPYQGHGWGYRYLHGLLGSAALLAGYGYREIAKQDRKEADGAVVVLGAITAFIMLPASLWSAYNFVKPHAELHAIITDQATDFVIVDNVSVPLAVDEARNRADLSNTPLVFARSKLSDNQIALLCERGTVSVVGPEETQSVNLRGPVRTDGLLPKDPCSGAN